MNERFQLIRSMALLIAVLVGQGMARTVNAQDAGSSLVESLVRSLLGGPEAVPLTAEDAPIRIAREHVEVGITNAYDASGIRYLAIKLRVRNRSGMPLIVQSDRSYLRIGQDRIPRVTTAEQLDGTPVTLTGDQLDQVDPLQLQTPPDWKIAPDRESSGWMLFAPLPATRDLPDIHLHVVTSQGEIPIELTRIENEQLKLESQRIGPGGCVGTTRIQGDLNVINVPHLVETLRTLSRQGVTHLVVSFGLRANLNDQLLEEWLIDGQADDDNLRMKYLPSWSGLFREVVVTGIPGQTDETGESLAASESEAIRKVTQKLIPQLGVSAFRQQLREGHPDIRGAILSDHGDLVAQFEPDLLLAALADDKTIADTRVSLVRALRSLSDNRALGLLEQFVREGSREEAAVALRSLNLSPLPAARTRAISLAREPAVQKRIGLPRILRSVGTEVDEAWIPFLRESFAADDPVAREQALQQIFSSGVDDLLPILERAFADRSPNVRHRAYQSILGSRTDEEEVLFARETQRRFRAGLRDPDTLTGIGELRDASYVPDLLKSIDQGLNEDDQLVEVCLNLGGNDVLPEMEKRISRFTVNSQRRILRLAFEQSLPSARTLANQLLLSSDEELRSISCLILWTLADEKSIETLRAAILQNPDPENEISLGIVRVIGLNASPRSLEFLNSLTREGNENLNRLGQMGLRIYYSSIPAMNWREVAQDLNSQGLVEQSIEALKLLLEIDPDDWNVCDTLGFRYLQLSRHPEARKYFDRARELQPDDHQSLTGIAICIAVDGKWEEAIKLVDSEESLRRHSRSSVYLYNVACVYGRAIEGLRKQPATTESELRCRAWETRAMHFLRKSFDSKAPDRQFQDVDLVAKDPDLNSIRHLPEFQKLLNQLQESLMDEM